jgi:hypothetical protein
VNQEVNAVPGRHEPEESTSQWLRRLAELIEGVANQFGPSCGVELLHAQGTLLVSASERQRPIEALPHDCPDLPD